MWIRFLGTGGPDGFYRGGAGVFHEQARRLGGRNWRRPSALYVAPDCLIDFSRACPAQLRRFGIQRGRIKRLLITHSHDDHFDPQAIVAEMARRDGVCDVYGNEIVCRKLGQVMEDKGLRMGAAVHLLKPFHEVAVGGLRVIPVKANHCWTNDEGEPETALNFILQSPEASLLYLVDTRLMYQETHEFIRQFTYDGVILDTGFGDMRASDMSEGTGHCNFEQGKRIMESFEEDGLLRPGARKIFSHVSTAHVDLHQRLAPRLAKEGYTLAYDGMSVTLGADHKKAGFRTNAAGRRAEARWIWSPPQEDMKNFYLYARKKLFLNEPPEKAPLMCACRGVYQLYVNGRFLGRGPSPCDARRQYFDRYDIAPFLRTGENVIAVVAYSLGVAAECVTGQNPGQPGLYVRGEVRCKGGGVAPIASSPAWRVKRSSAWAASVSRLNRWLGYREVFDTRLEDDGWKEPGYDDFKWLMPDIVKPASDGVETRLIEREIPFLEEREVLPRTVFRIDKNLGAVRNADALVKETGRKRAWMDCAAPGASPAVLLDFGREVVGYPVLSIGRNAGGTLILSYGETLDLRSYDALALSGKPVAWSPFGRRAFRYLQLTAAGGPEPVEIRKIALRSVSYPVRPVGDFRCSDAMLNRIWRVGRDTVHLCMQDHFECCPARDQSLCIGDLLWDAPVACYAFGESRLTRKCLRQIAAIQHPEGWMPAVGPIQSKTLLTDFCAYWVTILHEHYLHTGDRELLEELYPSFERLMAWFAKQEDPYHLLHPGQRAAADEWCFIDRAPVDKRDEVTALQCAYHKALLDAAAICDALGKGERAAFHRKHAGVVRKAINDRLWDDWRIFIDCRTRSLYSKKVSVPTNALALLCGVASGARAKKIIQYLSECDTVTPAGTPFMTGLFAKALFHHDRGAEAIQMIREYWGEMIRRGATTFWEEFDPRTPRTCVPLSLDDNHSMTSLCRGWSGGPTYLLPAYALGVRPISPGFQEFLIAPQPGNLAWAEGRIPTPRGEIALRWERDKRHASMRISLQFPRSCQARLELPVPAGGKHFELNRTLLKAGRQIVPGVRYLRKAKDRLLFHIAGGGAYELMLTACRRLASEASAKRRGAS